MTFRLRNKRRPPAEEGVDIASGSMLYIYLSSHHHLTMEHALVFLCNFLSRELSKLLKKLNMNLRRLHIHKYIVTVAPPTNHSI